MKIGSAPKPSFCEMSHDLLGSLWWLLLVFTYYISIVRGEPKKVDTNLLRPLWLQWANETVDANRTAYLSAIFEKIAGVYVDKSKIRNPKLAKTVLIQVVESLGPNVDNGEKYREQLLNFYCFTKHYGWRSALYLITRAEDEAWFDKEKAFYTSFNPFVEVIKFPYALFWEIVAQKTTPISLGSGFGDYNESSPAFLHFGALPMLVPPLEAIELGYNVVYLDSDMVFYADPLPIFLRSQADILVAPELKNCKFPSLSFRPQRSLTEPNTGTLFLSANDRVVNFMRLWLRRIVQNNAMNDQRTMHLHQHGKWIRDCELDERVNHVMEVDGIHSRLSPNSSQALQYCILHEMLFFTGMVEKFCSKGLQGSNSNDFYLSMARQSLVQRVGKVVNQTAALLPFNLYQFLSKQFLKDGYPYYHYPVAFHANYCGNKRRCFEDRSVWLVQSQRGGGYKCDSFDLLNTHYVKGTNWAERMHFAQQALFAALYQVLNIPPSQTTTSKVDLVSTYDVEQVRSRLEGYLIKHPHDRTIYKVENGQFRPFSSYAAFVAHNGSVENTRLWMHEMLQHLPLGFPL